MQLSAAGLELLKKSEGFRGRVYLDVAGFPTIGFGHKLLHPLSFPAGISEPDAEDLLTSDVNDAIQAVQRLVKVQLSQGQFDALVDFVYNLGAERLSSSTLLKKLNAGLYDEAATELFRWNHAGGKEVPGLKARREAEVALWRGGDSHQPSAISSQPGGAA